jgi:hypothetical protein
MKEMQTVRGGATYDHVQEFDHASAHDWGEHVYLGVVRTKAGVQELWFLDADCLEEALESLRRYYREQSNTGYSVLVYSPVCL